MDKQEKEVIKELVEKSVQNIKIIDDREEISRSLFYETEEKTKQAVTAKQRYENEKMQFFNGDSFTIAKLENDYQQYIAEIEKDHESKFTLFLTRLGNLCNWSDEEKAKFRKPKIAAITIIEVIYLRFPEGLLNHIRACNKYIGYYVRRTKNYKLLNEEGILLLEQYIDDANILMAQSKTYYEFRKRMFDLFGVPFQVSMFGEVD